MRLRDKLDILDSNNGIVHQDVPCYVGNATSAAIGNSVNPYPDVTQLRAIIPAQYSDVQDQSNRILWRGKRYSIPAPVLPRMRGDKVDHYTLVMVLVTTG